MNLQKVPYSNSSAQLYFTCFGCGMRHSITESYTDHDGPPFEAYYCTRCALPLLYAQNVPQTHEEAIAAFQAFINQRPDLTLEEYGYDDVQAYNRTEGAKKLRKEDPRRHSSIVRGLQEQNAQAVQLRKQDYGTIYRAKVRADKALDTFASPYRGEYSPALLANALRCAFSGRLKFNNEGQLEYTAGQTFAGEYRDAAASVLEYYNRG